MDETVSRPISRVDSVILRAFLERLRNQYGASGDSDTSTIDSNLVTPEMLNQTHSVIIVDAERTGPALATSTYASSETSSKSAGKGMLFVVLP